MTEIIMFVVLACTPHECRQFEYPTQEANTHACMMHSALFVALHTKEKPGWEPKKWRCETGGREI